MNQPMRENQRSAALRHCSISYLQPPLGCVQHSDLCTVNTEIIHGDICTALAFSSTLKSLPLCSATQMTTDDELHDGDTD